MIAVLMIPMLVALVGLLAHGTLADAFVNRHAKRLRQLVTILIGGLLLTALGMAGGQLAEAILGGTGRQPWILSLPSSFVGLGLYIDGLSCLMLLVIGLVGLVVSRYSLRYLDGETRQGTYFKWLAFTLGAVATMVASATLVQFFVFWTLTSLGLHRLLLYYPERPAARRAAWKKFVISRVGDLFLLVALCLVYQSYGTFAFSELFSTAVASKGADGWISWCLMLAAITKSAQFPFHTWLPNTMETPTPVSALMHAGIVNGGGFLLIRTSPLFSLSPSAMAILTVVGTVTACYGSVVMMTQPSVKRALAYSTIAQMGFMLLQCGLGAFSAAMLHIVAHSLYKAYAFLMSGSVAMNAGREALSLSSSLTETSEVPSVGRMLLAGASVTVLLTIVLVASGANPLYKPGGLALALAMIVALTAWSGQVLAVSRGTRLVPMLLTLIGLCGAYALSLVAVDSWIRPALPTLSTSPYAIAQLGLIGFAFSVLFWLHAVVQRPKRPEWLKALRVHAMNGFYLDPLIERWWPTFSKV